MNISIIGGNARNKGALLMLNASIEIIKIFQLIKFTSLPLSPKKMQIFNQFNNKNYGFEILIVSGIK